MTRLLVLAVVFTTALFNAKTAFSQSFMFDDLPTAPIFPSPFTTPGQGGGAENPWGFAVPPATPSGPSPLLGVPLGLTLGDGDIFASGFGAIAAPTPVPFISSLSDALILGPPNSDRFSYQIHFSVDRLSIGLGGTAVNTQAALNQQSSDIFASGTTFISPANFIGAMGTLPVRFAGNLASAAGPTSGNSLASDESALGIPATGAFGFVGPLVATASIGNGTHNNVDGFDYSVVAAAGVFSNHAYLSGYPDAVLPFGLPVADVLDVGGNTATLCGTVFAAAATMGLTDFDVIDAIIVIDTAPIGSPGCGGPGAQPGVDGILFSLAPGSPSLRVFGLDAGDIFLSDFTGRFGRYATATQLGLRSTPTALPTANPDNVDAAELRCTGDVDFDGVVNTSDIVIINNCIGSLICGDVDGDGVTNDVDVTAAANNFGCSAS